MSKVIYMYIIIFSKGTNTFTINRKNVNRGIVPFTACSNNNHGASCGIPCDCVDSNAINSHQSCNHIRGRCECKATWQGNRCETDVDECAADPNLCRQKQNEGCHNLKGTYECSCFVGYSRNSGGICVRSKTSESC